MLGDLPMAHVHDVDSLEFNFSACRRHPEKFSQMRPMIGFVGHHPVTISKLPMDFGVEVGESGAEDFVQLARAGPVAVCGQ